MSAARAGLCSGGVGFWIAQSHCAGVGLWTIDGR